MNTTIAYFNSCRTAPTSDGTSKPMLFSVSAHAATQIVRGRSQK